MVRLIGQNQLDLVSSNFTVTISGKCTKTRKSWKAIALAGDLITTDTLQTLRHFTTIKDSHSFAKTLRGGVAGQLNLRL